MFDIGFWEIIVIAIVALLVVGPDKLPGLIKGFPNRRRRSGQVEEMDATGISEPNESGGEDFLTRKRKRTL